MSVKENIAMIKNELSAEEKFFEQAVVTERFVKKYKSAIVALVVAVVVVVVAGMVYDINISNKKESANRALASLMKNPADASALSELKSSSEPLYDVWKLSEAIKHNDLAQLESLASSKTELMADLAKYESASSTSSLNSYAQTQNAIYADLAKMRSASLLLKEQRVSEARVLLSQIEANSPLYELAKSLLHYGIAK
ncbi:MAG: tetratricopeptide repeat protein [Sulfuricurvum sp.]